MTSEARHLDSPPPTVSVKARAQEIEARSGAGAKAQVHAGSTPTPVARQDSTSTPKKDQVTSGSEGIEKKDPGSNPSRRCSEGDLFQHCKVRHPPPTAPRPRRVSLENVTVPAVPARRSTLGRLVEKSEGSCSGENPCQTQTPSKFAPFTGKSGVTCKQPATADFRPAIFSSSRSLAPPKQSPLDDIITALEKICDEFTLPESTSSTGYSLEASSLPRGYDDVFEKCVRRCDVDKERPSSQSSHHVNDKAQWLTEHGVPQVADCQQIQPDANRKCSESKLLLDGSQSVKHSSPHHDQFSESEPVVYRSTFELSPKSSERHVVSATLLVSPPNLGSKTDFQRLEYPSSNTLFSASFREESNSEKTTKFEKSHDAKVTTDYLGVNSRKDKNNRSKSNNKNNENSVPRANLFTDIDVGFGCSVRNELTDFPTSTHLKSIPKLTIEDEPHKHAKDEVNEKAKKAATSKQGFSKVLTHSASLKESTFLSTRDESYHRDETRHETSPSEDLEKIKNILANLDFEKYKRRSSLNDMDEKSPKPTRAHKTSSAKFKDLFDLLKPNTDNSSSSKPLFGLCRSSSFSNAESLASDSNAPSFFLQSEENDAVTPLPDDAKKISTLPRRKSPSRQLFTKVSSPPPVPAVASCPSIVRLENPIPAIHDPSDPDPTQDEGLVSDSEVGPGAYVTAYVSCVTSSSPATQFCGRRGHVRSASDNVTSGSTSVLPEVRIKKTSSTEKLWISVTSRLNGSEKQRKRRKGIGSKQNAGDMEPDSTKSGSSRSLTYPPQRKSSTSEEEQEFSSVDSNGLKSLKLQTTCLLDSGSDAVRLLSDLSLADSHLCPSEGTLDETYLDVVNSVMHSPSGAQHLSVHEATSPGNGKTHKKKHHSDPGGEAGTSCSNENFIADALVGSSRSEPDLGGNESSHTPNSSSCSSASSETSSRATQTPHIDHDERQHPLKLVIDVVRNGEGTKNTRPFCGGSLTSGASPSSRFQFPDTDSSNQRLAIESNQSSKSPQEQRRYSKRRLRGPYGEMLEEEMRKSGEKQKSALSDLSFLHELAENTAKNQDAAAHDSAPTQSPSRPAMFLSSQSLDDASSTPSKNELSMCVTPKRKISANYPLLNDSEHVAIASDEDISPTKPAGPNESPAKSDASRNENSADSKNESQPKNKEDVKGLTDFTKIHERHSDTRTHVVAELYDTEKSYVESLQILANLSILCIKTSWLPSLTSASDVLVLCVKAM